MKMARISMEILYCIAFLPFAFVASTKSCGEPPTGPGLKVINRFSNYPIGTIVFYQCDFGFYSEEYFGTTRCVAGKGTSEPEWEEPEFICTQQCRIPRIPHGEILESESPDDHENQQFRTVDVDTPMGERYEYILVCEPTYKPMGQHTKAVRVTCKNRKWSRKPECLQVEFKCDVLIAPQHGNLIYITDETTEVGSKVVFSCDPDYVLIGSKTSKCEENIGWLFPTPNCTKPCFVPNISHGEIIQLKNNQTQVIQAGIELLDAFPSSEKEYFLRCNEGYNAKGHDARNVQIKCEKGHWSETLECLSEPCTVVNIAHGEIVELNNNNSVAVPVGTKVSGTTPAENEYFLECHDGYNPVNESARKVQITCEKGRWSKSLECLTSKNSCIVPEIANGEIIRSKRTHHIFERSLEGSKVHVGDSISQDEGGNDFNKYSLNCSVGYRPKEYYIERECDWTPAPRKLGNIKCKNGLLEHPECVKDLCVVPEIPNGEIVFVMPYRVPDHERERIPVGRSIPRPCAARGIRPSYQLSCNDGYKPNLRVNIGCENEQLSIKPECLGDAGSYIAE